MDRMDEIFATASNWKSAEDFKAMMGEEAFFWLGFFGLLECFFLMSLRHVGWRKEAFVVEAGEVARLLVLLARSGNTCS